MFLERRKYSVMSRGDEPWPLASRVTDPSSPGIRNKACHRRGGQADGEAQEAAVPDAEVLSGVHQKHQRSPVLVPKPFTTANDPDFWQSGGHARRVSLRRLIVRAFHLNNIMPIPIIAHNKRRQPSAGGAPRVQPEMVRPQLQPETRVVAVNHSPDRDHIGGRSAVIIP
ncbi:hypothetical protein MAPG_09513 [Magnaporthiopsis poae ATCC 64411]|uniref:Uncharacterized protein n=1 Tax=Magnaporthiopsis poae (strain ATCC 64411 / 73-15) TaxID=644358 RepID=A0A0C4EA54_MAGP6|nr:hypothetical protein MAPG_09513 [Magnaporthiopsis poae ATCC 64411]